MKTYTLILSFLCCAISASSILAQPPDTLWTQTFGGIGGNRASSVQQTADGGYILGGYTGSYGAGSYDMYLVKTDSFGTQEWQQTYGGDQHERCESVQQTTDSGYILGGFTYSFGAGERDMYLVKTDSLGIIEWDTTFGGNDEECGYSVLQTADGGFILGGWTNSFGAGYTDMYLVKTNYLGNLEWEQTIGGTGEEMYYAIQRTSDGGYILGGTIDSFGASGQDMYLVKTDSMGAMEWYACFGGDGTEHCYSLALTEDGGYILGGTIDSFEAESVDVYIVKTDSGGNQEWSRTFGGNSPDYCYSLEQTVDGGYILGGISASYNTSEWWDMYLVKIDHLGNLEWQQTYGRGSPIDWCESVQQTADGGFILGGCTGIFHAGWREYMYLVKLEVGGSQPQIPVTLTPENPPIIIPASGGSFNFNITVDNGYLVQLIFDGWIMVTLPDSTQYGPVLGPRNLTLPGGNSLDHDRIQDVPAGAPPGNYAYDAYVGVYPDIIWGSDNFSFEKLDSGDSEWNENWSNWGESFTIVEDIFIFHPISSIIYSSYPNPFNLTTTLTFTLPSACLVKLEVFDINACRVGVGLAPTRWYPPGTHHLLFNGSGLSSGVYLARLTAGDFTQTQKLVLLK